MDVVNSTNSLIPFDYLGNLRNKKKNALEKQSTQVEDRFNLEAASQPAPVNGQIPTPFSFKVPLYLLHADGNVSGHSPNDCYLVLKATLPI